MSIGQLTECDGCGKLTETIGGKCSSCWYVKDPRRAPPPRPEPKGRPTPSRPLSPVWDWIAGILRYWPW